MKKILKKFLVLALLLIQLIPTIVVKADNGMNSDDGVITINNAISGKTYSVYEILKLESYDTEKEAYRYTVTESWKTFIESTDIKDVYLEIDTFGYVTWKDGADVVAFSKLALSYAKDNSITATNSKEADSETVVFEDLNLGYYLVDSSLGALCGLNTTSPTATINEKNTEPTVTKQVKENSTNTFGDKNDGKIGDIVEFKTTITVGAGAENYVLYDELSTGLTLLDDEDYPITLKVGEEVVETTNYTKTTDIENGTFNIAFKNTYLDTLTSDTEIVVTYYALINEEAVIEGVGNPNETYLTYGDNHETTHDTTITYVYSFNLEKVDGDGVQLEGAEFRLYADNEEKEEIKLVYDEENDVYRVSLEDIEGDVIKVGTATIIGLDHKAYYLKETKQPEGYNILTSLVKVEVNGTDLTDTTEDITDTYEVTSIQVENLTGASLPSTGGIGTTIFIIIGSMMMLGFGILLATKLRMSKTNM